MSMKAPGGAPAQCLHFEHFNDRRGADACCQSTVALESDASRDHALIVAFSTFTPVKTSTPSLVSPQAPFVTTLQGQECERRRQQQNSARQGRSCGNCCAGHGDQLGDRA
jgi:hypothetical protein